MYKTGLVELDAVAAVAQTGGFRAAAAELGMSSTALSNAVAGLEARLGVRLFNRTTRSVSLTEVGEQFIAVVGPALADIHGAMEAVNNHRTTPAGTLRISSAVDGARQILAPTVITYLRRYPDMKVDLVTEARPVDIVAAGFDAGIRAAGTVPADMTAIPFGPPLRAAVAGAPDYLRENPPPRTPGELLAHRCLRIRQPGGVVARWAFARQGEALNIDVPGALTLDTPVLAREAALAGAGLAYIQEGHIADDLAAGRLVRVLEDWMPPASRLCLYHPGRRNLPAGLRVFIALIREMEGRPEGK